MNFILPSIIALLSLEVLAGSGPGKIECSSASGRTEVKILTKDLDQIESIEFLIDGKVITFDQPKQRSIVFARKDCVLTITARQNIGPDITDNQAFEFYGIPSSFNYISNESGNIDLKFNAKVICTDPKERMRKMTPTIKLGCTLKYEI